MGLIRQLRQHWCNNCWTACCRTSVGQTLPPQPAQPSMIFGAWLKIQQRANRYIKGFKSVISLFGAWLKIQQRDNRYIKGVKSVISLLSTSWFAPISQRIRKNMCIGCFWALLPNDEYMYAYVLIIYSAMILSLETKCPWMHATSISIFHEAWTCHLVTVRQFIHS